MFNSVVVPNSNFKMELDQLLKELRAERASLEDANLPHSTRLLDQGKFCCPEFRIIRVLLVRSYISG